MSDHYISWEKAISACGNLCPSLTTPDGSNPLDEEIFHIQEFLVDVIQTLNALPAADVVSHDCYNRILEENDTMKEQLASIGKKPGDKMDNVRRVDEANLILIARGKSPFVLLKCSGCGKKGWFGADIPKYCVNCGSIFNKTKMDGGETE